MSRTLPFDNKVKPGRLVLIRAEDMSDWKSASVVEPNLRQFGCNWQRRRVIILITISTNTKKSETGLREFCAGFVGRGARLIERKLFQSTIGLVTWSAGLPSKVVNGSNAALAVKESALRLHAHAMPKTNCYATSASAFRGRSWYYVSHRKCPTILVWYVVREGTRRTALI
jgi:hypothetical protein